MFCEKNRRIDICRETDCNSKLFKINSCLYSCWCFHRLKSVFCISLKMSISMKMILKFFFYHFAFKNLPLFFFLNRYYQFFCENFWDRENFEFDKIKIKYSILLRNQLTMHRQNLYSNLVKIFCFSFNH